MGVLDTIKDLAVLVQKADNLELLKHVLALQSQVQDMFNENRTLRDKVGALEATIELARSLSFRAPFYFVVGDETPFCPRCWEVDRKAVHVVLIFRNGSTRWDCKQCNQTYLIKG